MWKMKKSYRKLSNWNALYYLPPNQSFHEAVALQDIHLNQSLGCYLSLFLFLNSVIYAPFHHNAWLHSQISVGMHSLQDWAEYFTKLEIEKKKQKTKMNELLLLDTFHEIRYIHFILVLNKLNRFFLHSLFVYFTRKCITCSSLSYDRCVQQWKWKKQSYRKTNEK